MTSTTSTIAPSITTPTPNLKTETTDANMFKNLIKAIGNLMNPKTIIQFTETLLPSKFVSSIKLMGTGIYHSTMLIIFVLSIYLMYRLLEKQILSMLGIFIMLCIIGLFYIRFSYNSQVKINKYTILFNRLCVKYKNDPLCKQYLTLLNEKKNK